MQNTWTLDHVGIAVANLEKAIRHYQTTTSATLGHREILHEQGVELVFINVPGSKIELLAPLNEQSTVRKFIQHRGPGLHHICYRVDAIEKELQRLVKSGYQLIDTTPRAGAGGSRIAFIHPASCEGVLTEICEYPDT